MKEKSIDCDAKNGNKIILTNGSDTFQYDNGETGTVIKKKHGIGVLTTILFIAGETAGCGTLALPYALTHSGRLGLPLMVMTIFDATICGILIGKCWVILEERWPEYRQNCRFPYPAIGRMAYGNGMEKFVTICLQLTLIGGSVVVYIVCVQLISNLSLQVAGVDMYFSAWLLIVGVVLVPLVWLGSPVDMWWAGAAALGTTLIAVTLILIDITHDYQLIVKQPELPSPTFASTSLAFGTFIFAIGALPTFPTLQNDMRDKSKFTRSVITAHSTVLTLYLGVALLGRETYGESVKTNVTLSLPTGNIRNFAMFSIACHLVFAFSITINGALQEIEDKLKMPQTFGWKRVFVRTTCVLFIIFISGTVPKFGKVLDLVGGSTLALLTFICPCIFYMKLCSMKNDSWPQRKLSIFEKLYYYKIIIYGTFGGISCTYWALMAILAPGAFSLPCYIDIYCSSE